MSGLVYARRTTVGGAATLEWAAVARSGWEAAATLEWEAVGVVVFADRVCVLVMDELGPVVCFSLAGSFFGNVDRKRGLVLRIVVSLLACCCLRSGLGRSRRIKGVFVLCEVCAVTVEVGDSLAQCSISRGTRVFS